MPYYIISKSDGRISIGPGISTTELREIANLSTLSTIQFAEPLSEKELDSLQEYIFNVRPETTLRVYGHYSSECDLSFLKKFPSIKGFSADCLMNAKNVECINYLTNLEQLGIGIYKLTSLDFIKENSSNLKQLEIGATFSKKPSLDFLSKFIGLEDLYIEGQANGINHITELKNLQKIVLRSVTVSNLDFLLNSKNLWSVDIKLGGIKNFSALTKLPHLKFLELWQINKLADISFISELKELQNLFIQSLRNVEALPRLDRNIKLRRIYLENLKGLKDLIALKYAPALEEFCYVLAQNQQPKDLTPVLENQNVKKVFVKFGSTTKNNLFDEMALKAGKEQYKSQKFIYN